MTFTIRAGRTEASAIIALAEQLKAYIELGSNGFGRQSAAMDRLAVEEGKFTLT